MRKTRRSKQSINSLGVRTFNKYSYSCAEYSCFRALHSNTSWGKHDDPSLHKVNILTHKVRTVITHRPRLRQHNWSKSLISKQTLCSQVRVTYLYVVYYSQGKEAKLTVQITPLNLDIWTTSLLGPCHF